MLDRVVPDLVHRRRQVERTLAQVEHPKVAAADVGVERGRLVGRRDEVPGTGRPDVRQQARRVGEREVEEDLPAEHDIGGGQRLGDRVDAPELPQRGTVPPPALLDDRLDDVHP
ncbi:hypothetical protein GCM10027259_30330 [Micromonospora palomenae]|nr:hypothetical protein [Micromonospora palomenae]